MSVVASVTKTNFAAINDALTLDVTNLNSVRFEFVGTYSFTAVFEALGIDGVTWYPFQVAAVNTPTIVTQHATANATQAYDGNCAMVSKVRVRLSAFTSAGTHSVGIAAADAPVEPNPIVSLAAGSASIGVVDTELPAAAALADALANPTAPQVGSANELYNNASWDRARNNYALNLDTSSAKTATGNGATGTNHNFRGAEIFVNVTAVSGTTPTMTVRLQESFDGGTTWRDVDTTNAQTASITATGVSKLVIYPGVATAANASLNGVLPRTFRLAWTIGGTTPSFTFASWINFVV